MKKSINIILAPLAETGLPASEKVRILKNRPSLGHSENQPGCSNSWLIKGLLSYLPPLTQVGFLL